MCLETSAFHVLISCCLGWGQMVIHALYSLGIHYFRYVPSAKMYIPGVICLILILSMMFAVNRHIEIPVSLLGAWPHKSPPVMVKQCAMYHDICSSVRPKLQIHVFGCFHSNEKSVDPLVKSHP
jgi:hypothetical protein